MTPGPTCKSMELERCVLTGRNEADYALCNSRSFAVELYLKGILGVTWYHEPQTLFDREHLTKN